MQICRCRPIFQSTPPVKAATFPPSAWCCLLRYISIHAAREGGDCSKKIYFRRNPISIHAAREGGDLQRSFAAVSLFQFQSTPPVKAATIAQQLSEIEQRISIHAAREGGDYSMTDSVKIVAISIHAAREGGDGLQGDKRSGKHDFNPRRP